MSPLYVFGVSMALTFLNRFHISGLELMFAFRYHLFVCARRMDWAASEFDGKLKVVKVDTGEDDKLVKDYNIHGLPTFAVFKQGEAFGIKEGAMGKVALEEYIIKYAPEVA